MSWTSYSLGNYVIHLTPTPLFFVCLKNHIKGFQFIMENPCLNAAAYWKNCLIAVFYIYLFLLTPTLFFFCLTNHISRWFPIYIEKPLLFCFSSDPTEMSHHSLLYFLVPCIRTTYLSPEIQKFLWIARLAEYCAFWFDPSDTNFKRLCFLFSKSIKWFPIYIWKP